MEQIVTADEARKAYDEYLLEKEPQWKEEAKKGFDKFMSEVIDLAKRGETWANIDRYCYGMARKYFIEMAKEAGYTIGNIYRSTGGSNPENIVIENASISWVNEEKQ